MNLEITIHSVGQGTCSLTGKETDGITVTFKDGTTTESFLSYKGFAQLVQFKLKPGAKAGPDRLPSANGEVAADA
jgi:hypothetical protein